MAGLLDDDECARRDDRARGPQFADRSAGDHDRVFVDAQLATRFGAALTHPSPRLDVDPFELNGPRGLAIVGAKAYVAVYFSDKLAVVDYSRNALASRIAIERCPTGAIVWLDDGNAVLKGKAAARIVRKGALPVGAHSTRV